MPTSLLEEDMLEPYTAWKAAPGPASNSVMLKALRPTIDSAIRTYVGEPNPLIASRARLLTLKGLASYDDSRGKLKTHTFNQLQGLKRANRQQTTILKVPERIQLDQNQLNSAIQELSATLGREPTDAQLSDFTGFSPARIAKVRRYKSGISEGYLADLEAKQVGFSGGSARLPSIIPVKSFWQDIVYDEMDDYHKKIMELALGLNGRRAISNAAIAAKLGKSPGAISQAKARIQAALDAEYEL
jgi:hypothetical protein